MAGGSAFGVRRSQTLSPRPMGGLERLEPRALLAAVSWDGGGGNDLWSNPLNWSGDAVPTIADDVTIHAPGVQRRVIVDVGPARVRSLALDETLIVNSGVVLSVSQAFDLTAGADLRINGLVNWAAGVWEPSGPIRVQPGGRLNIGSSTSPTEGQVTLRSSLDNQGRLAWQGGSLQVGGTGVILNNIGKRFDIAAAMELAGELGVPGLISNSGVIRKGGMSGDPTIIDVNVTNTAWGQINVLRGTLQFGYALDESEQEILNAGRMFVAEGRMEFLNGATHQAARFFGGEIAAYAGVHRFLGLTNFAASNVSFNDDANVEIPDGPTSFFGRVRLVRVPLSVLGTLEVEGTLFLSGGPTNARLPVIGEGNINVGGILAVANGDLQAPINIEPGGTLQLLNAGSGNSTRVRDVITNNGTLEIGAGEIWSDGAGRVDSTSIIRKTGDTTVDWLIPLDLQLPGPGTPEIEVVAGVLRLDSDGSDFASPGLIDLQGGVLELDLGAGTFSNSGTLIVDADAEFEVSGNMTTSGTVRSFITTEDFGSVTVTGTLSIEGGTLRSIFVGDGFVANQERSILSAASRVGTFTTLSQAGLPASLTIEAQYLATAVVVLIIEA